MSDLIDRQQAIDALRDAENHAFNSYYQGLIKAHKIIADLPSAQPERMNGKWTPHREKSCEYIGATLVYVTYDYWFCDTCGYRVEDGQPLYNFCPNCGADMRG